MSNLGRHKERIKKSIVTMASEQAITNETIAKAVAEVNSAAIQAVVAAVAERPQSAVGPKIGRPAMKQPSFNWEADNKYNKHKTFRVEVSNILTVYITPQTEQPAIVKNWVGRKGLLFIELLTHAEKDTCSTLEGLFKILTKRFRLQLNDKMIKALQFHKLSRQKEENAEEWLGRLWLLAIECNYKELDRQLKEQFIHGLNDTDMLGEIIWELTKIHENEEITS